MTRPAFDSTDSTPLDRLAERPAHEADAVRAARLRHDATLSPAQRLEKLAAMCRQADVLRTARRVR